MELGFAVPQSGSWATPDNLRLTATRAEELGYRSLWTFQRLLYPADPGRAEEPARWPDVYRSVLDPLTVLGFLAAATTRVRLGIAVLNLPFFSPPLLAKQAATLDVLSGGRLDLGLGLGWAAEEYAATGADRSQRGQRAEEFIHTLKLLFAEESADFTGRFYTLPGVRLDPKPIQQPHPPILLGGTAEVALRRAGRVADGWISSSGQDLTSMKQAADVVRTAAAEAGRDPERLRVICRGVVRVRPPGATERRMLSGSWAEIRDDLARLAGQGVTETFLDLNFDREVGSPQADPQRSLDRALQALVELRPQTWH